MSDLITQCQCQQVPGDERYRCGNRMTQEDLLCDTCRDGCNAGVRWENDSQPGYHMRISGWRLEGIRLDLPGPVKG